MAKGNYYIIIIISNNYSVSVAHLIVFRKIHFVYTNGDWKMLIDVQMNWSERNTNLADLLFAVVSFSSMSTCIYGRNLLVNL